MGGRDADSSTADNRKRVSKYLPHLVRLLIRFRDRNWLEFLAVLDSTFSMEGNSAEHVEAARKLFAGISEHDGLKDRSGPLALLELEKRARERSISKGIRKVLQTPLFELTPSLRPENPGKLPQVVLRPVW